MNKTLTLTFVISGEQVLLGQKQRGFGVGLFNGYGGKVEAGETIVAAARRELLEESGLTARTLTPAGELTFTYEDTGEVMVVYVFVATVVGEPVVTEEMVPKWFPLTELPYEAMWSDDPYWLPQVLAGNIIHGHFTFSAPEHATHKATIKESHVVVVGSW
jgi:8-oxo-dGTP pyrophosphatase MutT (NUDIX family)